jgi:hypothetical protein
MCIEYRDTHLLVCQLSSLHEQSQLYVADMTVRGGVGFQADGGAV